MTHRLSIASLALAMITLAAVACNVPLSSPTPTRWPTISPLTETPTPSGDATSVLGPTVPVTPATLAPSPTPTVVTPPDNPLGEYAIEYLRSRPYDGGVIQQTHTTTRSDELVQYAIDYLSDGIRVTGLVTQPAEGTGPWPVIIILHGGVDQSAYTPGDGTNNHAFFFARNGYMAIAPDYRTYNNTEGSGSPLKIPWAIDVMNLIAALPTLPGADPSRVGVMGQSRGGGLASYIMVLSDDVDAVSLYAPLSTNQSVVWERYATVFGAQWPLDDAAIWGSPETNPDGYRMVSPFYYLDLVSMPVQIHHGTLDGTLPVQWSRDLAADLQSLGKTVEYYEYPEADHTFYDADYDLFLQRNLTFFSTYLN